MSHQVFYTVLWWRSDDNRTRILSHLKCNYILKYYYTMYKLSKSEWAGCTKQYLSLDASSSKDWMMGFNFGTVRKEVRVLL